MVEKDKRFSTKTILVAAVSVLLLVAMFIGLVLAMPSRSVNQKAEAATTDFTQPTTEEQVKINDEINQKWGNPSSTPKLLSGTIKKISCLGSHWYYLNSDVTANIDWSFKTETSTLAGGNVRIVLNGYSISGTFGLLANLSTESAVLSIFDKIPGRSGVAYDYNPNPVKYYKYNSGTGGYTDYYTSLPNGTDVTSMPTFKTNTYIKVTGSAFSPNALNTSTMNVYVAAFKGLLNMYGINFVGCQNYDSAIIYVGGLGTLNLYQCTAIGNRSKGTDYYAVGGLVMVGYELNGDTSLRGGTANLNYCKIYGTNTASNHGMQPSNAGLGYKMIDIDFGRQSTGVLNAYKSNLGAIVTYSSTRSASIKDVNFGNTTVKITPSTVNSFFENINDISGTIELGQGCTTNYTGNSPNLNFILRGRDNINSSSIISGYNNLTLSSGAKVNIVVVSGTGQIESGATIRHIFHDGANGKLIDRQQSLVIDKGTAGSSSKVTINDGATLTALDIKAGNYLGTGAITNPPKTDIGNTAGITVGLSGTSFVYNGQAQTPAVTVTDNGTALTQGTDYTVSYSNNTNAGTATVTVTGMGYYTGTKTATFTITGMDIANNSNVIVSVAGDNFVYTGQVYTPAVTVIYNGVVLKQDTDYMVSYANNVYPGTATATIMGIGNYSGSKTATFTITSANFASSNITVTLSGSNFVYNGQRHTPLVTVKNNGTTLTQNTDYTVAYSDNVNAGTALVTVTGAGNYTGTKTATFTIAKATNPPTTPPQQVFVTQWGANLSAYANQLPRDWGWQQPNIAVNSNMTAVAVYNDTANYNNTTAQVQIVLQAQNPNNNLQDTNKISIVVNAGGMGGNLVYNGQPQMPALMVMANSIVLNVNTDYIVSYANNTNAGIATVTVTGIGSYYGTRSIPFIINKAANPPIMPQSSIEVTQSGTNLSAYANQLPSGWSWQNPNMAINGNMMAVAVYDDTANYNNTMVMLSIVYNVGPVVPDNNAGGSTGNAAVEKSNNTGVIIAIVVTVGVLLLILIVFLIVFLIIKKSREEREREARLTEMKMQAAMQATVQTAVQQALMQQQNMLNYQDMAWGSRQLGMRRPMTPSLPPRGIYEIYDTRPPVQLPYRSSYSPYYEYTNHNYPYYDNRR